jgi:serine/threonine protein phosphatase PrpC
MHSLKNPTESLGRKWRTVNVDIGQFCIDCYNGNSSQALFGVFDGHGGEVAADYCINRFPEEFQSALKASDSVHNAFSLSFSKIDSQLKLEDTDTTGTTACVAYITMEKTERVLYVANIGDSRAILGSSGKGVRLSLDHKCNEPTEIQRIATLGGKIENNRVSGLAVTRSLGDFKAKANSKAAIICEPYVSRTVLKSTDKWLIIGSDGLYDQLSDQDIINAIYPESDSDKVAKISIKLALDKGSQDNITCITIKLN